MSTPISLTQLREEATSGAAYIRGWDSDLARPETLLALIDTAEAAHQLNNSMSDPHDPNLGRRYELANPDDLQHLREALARFDFT